MKKVNYAIIGASIFLLTYLLLEALEADFRWVLLMFVLSPFVVLWMAYMILKHGEFKGKELAADEEYGYGDKDKSKLGMWG